MTTLLPSVRIPALRLAIPQIAQPWVGDPRSALMRHFREVLETRMSGLPFLNPAINVAVVECQSVAGDWLAGVVTPWSLQLVLLPGGGSLWHDTPVGGRQVVALPAGELVFIGDEGEAALPAFQYCPLITPVQHIADSATAMAIMRDAWVAMLTPPPTEPATPVAAPSAPISNSRRAFLRGAFR
ncbi:MAG: [NiFe]-hydrogenase assembly chaperone HybE [Rhodocyclales bacterium]|nr:[NiFe]-hydrogenase assembly chaperone HybE [Rhodocyclales bacterium]